METEMQKTCMSCNENLPVDSFSRRSDNGKLNNKCRSCRSKQESARAARKWREDPSYRENAEQVAKIWKQKNADRINLTRRMRQYNLTEDECNGLFDGHNGRCAICLSDNPGYGRSGKKGWSIDHDHVTGKVRGLLCNACNLGLGKFKDNMANLERAIAYLEVHVA